MRFVPFTASVTLLLVLPLVVEAGQGGKGKKGSGTHGVITSVDTKAETFTIRMGKKKDPNAQEMTVEFNDKTKFVRLQAGAEVEVKVDDLAAKQHVIVVHETKGDKKIATKVTLVERKKKQT